MTHLTAVARAAAFLAFAAAAITALTMGTFGLLDGALTKAATTALALAVN